MSSSFGFSWNQLDGSKQSCMPRVRISRFWHRTYLPLIVLTWLGTPLWCMVPVSLNRFLVVFHRRVHLYRLLYRYPLCQSDTVAHKLRHQFPDLQLTDFTRCLSAVYDHLLHCYNKVGWKSLSSDLPSGSALWQHLKRHVWISHPKEKCSSHSGDRI